MFTDVLIRAFQPEDNILLRRWLTEYENATLEVPHSFVGRSTETAVAEKKEKVIASLTGTLAVVLDPLLKNPEATHLDILVALTHMTKTLEYWGNLHGAVDAYITVPDSMTKYHEIVKRAGFVEVAEDCKVFKHTLYREKNLISTEEESSVSNEMVEVENNG